MGVKVHSAISAAHFARSASLRLFCRFDSRCTHKPKLINIRASTQIRMWLDTADEHLLALSAGLAVEQLAVGRRAKMGDALLRLCPVLQCLATVTCERL